MTIGHLPSGFVLAYLTHNKWGLRLKGELLSRFMFFWMLGAIFPDVDTLSYLASGAELTSHRQFITHTPFLYGLIAVVVFWYGWTMKKTARRRWYVLWGAFLGGVMLHLAGDSIFYGIRWAYPLSDHYFGLFPQARVSVSGIGELFSKYLFSGFFVPDFVFCLIAWWILFEKRFGNQKMLDIWRQG